MNKHRFFIVLSLVLLISGTAYAANHSNDPGNTPAILASLDQSGVTTLDDTAIAGIRGQAYPQYVLVKVLGLNTFDFGPGVHWTWNPLGYRYGFWGGPNWTNGGDTSGTAPTADSMDALFMTHDQVYANPASTAGDKLTADNVLLAGLAGLAVTPSYWGHIYIASPTGLTSPFVNVSGLSLVGGRLFFGWRAMPYTEYSRREAVAGMQALIFGKSFLSP